MAVNDWKQSAVVWFRKNHFSVCIAPPGHDMNAITAAAKIARKRGQTEIASEMMAHPDECEINWKNKWPTRNKNPRQKKLPKPANTSIMIPTQPIFGDPKPPRRRPTKRCVSEKSLVLLPDE